MPIDEVYKLINAIDNNKTEFYSLPYISKRLRKLVVISELTDDNIKDEQDEFQQIKDELKQTKDKLEQEFRDVKNLLNSLIKN